MSRLPSDAKNKNSNKIPESVLKISVQIEPEAVHDRRIPFFRERLFRHLINFPESIILPSVSNRRMAAMEKNNPDPIPAGTIGRAVLCNRILSDIGIAGTLEKLADFTGSN